jgi:hypothetical protein
VNPLSLVPTAWLWPAAGVLGLAMASAIGVQTLRVHSAQAELAKAQSARDKQTADREKVARDAERQARVEERRLAAANLESVNEAERLAARMRDHAAAAAAAGGGMLERARALAARCDRRPEAATTAAASAPATGAGDLFADVLGRMDAHGRQLAAAADQARIAGSACERAYMSLTPSTTDP